jgi:two-component system, LytTR family, response regulator
MTYSCLIVDDEPIAQKIIEGYVEKLDFLQLAATCKNAFEALKILHSQKIDILFLDIKMPGLSGLEMLQSLKTHPSVVLTSAYPEFGVDSYDYEVADYLLKPIAFERFLKAINRIISPQSAHAVSDVKTAPAVAPNFTFFKSDKVIHKLFHDEILYIEAYGNYLKIHNTLSKQITILDKISNLEQIMDKLQFVRVHRSFLINFAHVREVFGNTVRIGNHEIPMSSNYKAPFFQKMYNQ